MREILFRGRSVDSLDDGEWIYGYYNVHRGGLDDEYHDYIREKYMIDHEVDPDTLSQFTGLLDKNWNRIFEGDILKDEFCNYWLVSYELGAFCISNGHSAGTLFDSYVHDIIPGVVCGNKWDNPELLNP